MRIAVVTDSTASLTDDERAAAGVVVVPLHVVVDDADHLEGPGGLSPEELAPALRADAQVATARPAPAAFARAYREAAEGGAEAIVSVHLSAGLSSTLGSAQAAAGESPVPVQVIDSGTIGVTLGAVALGAAADAAVGRELGEVVERVDRRCAASSVRLYVDTLDHLRRGGRIGGARALLGSALAIKPILELRDGQVEPLERVRTRGKALARLVELTESACAALPDWADGAEVAVQHVDAPERAAEVAAQLAGRVPGEVRVLELSAVVGAHLGPGAIGVGVCPRPRG